MKKILSLLIVMVMFIGMRNVNAEMKKVNEAPNTLYGTITVMESDGWETKSNGDKYITQSYSVTQARNGYVYIRLLENTNVRVSDIIAGSNFELVDRNNTTVSANGTNVSCVELLFKLKSGATINGSVTLFDVTADIIDPNDLKCDLSYTPLKAGCTIVNNVYFDANGKEVTEAEFNEACGEPTPPQEIVPDTPNTGSAIPYIAIGIGLLAVAGLYLYSKKSNKFYKL